MLDLPYQDLFELIQQNENPFRTDGQAFADWCSRFGLLGILPHCAHTITLPARWEDIPGNAAGAIWRKSHQLESNQLVPTVTQHVRTPTGWRSVRMPFAPVGPSKRHRGVIAADRNLPPTCPLSGMIWTSPGETDSSSVSLDVLRPFFNSPSAGDIEHPMPLSADFWPIYCEPISEFWSAALMLRKSVGAIAYLKRKPLAEMRDVEAAMVLRDIERLNALASPVCLSLGVAGDGSKLVQRWAGPSLLSTLSHMALTTLADGQAHACQNCGSVFVSSAWQAKHCSPTCAHTSAKRELRKRQKTAVAMRRGGESIKVIAGKLGSTVPTVKGWLMKQTPH